MHRSSYLRMEYLVNFYEKYIFGDKEKVSVLDVGSYGVNGTYKDIFMGDRYHYVGLDMNAGPNVDIVPADTYVWTEIPDNSYDLVISGQAFEHIEFPWLTIKEIERVLCPSGLCIIIAPNMSPEHRYPTDCYRYFSDGMSALAKWANLDVVHVSVGGVPQIEGTDEWVSVHNDVCLVGQKVPGGLVDKVYNPFKFARRVMVKEECEDSYLLWEEAVRNTCKRFEEEKPFALFGAARLGKTIAGILGEDNVGLFIDNDPNKAGTKFAGKNVLSPADFVKVSDKYNCIITASYNNSCAIREQMKKLNIKGYILYPEGRDKFE